MSPMITIAVLPVALYVALAALPRGRPAMLGLVAAGLLAVLAAVSLAALGLGGAGLATAVLSVAATALAALMQALRRALGAGRAAWLYPVIVIAAPFAGSLPVILNLGI